MDDSPEIPDEQDGPTAAELEAAGQSAMFGDMAPAPALAPTLTPTASSTTTQPYRVLARKYRPQSFAQLIGQQAMVQTLANAIKRDRIAHAFLMTGVRGVGKTSTARLIAKALNCIGTDGQGGPTIDPCGQCEPCTAIAEGRHIDVLEMDAASNRGIDTVRELTEAVRYAAVSARYKIYIIDEVHMMTKEAFNALLKTLEEPPGHVKFLFATTEVDALPLTVLSRCQRFDLRRISVPMLAEHFATICAAEQVTADAEALEMIAAAAEGSVRDGLSILDQAIAHADVAGESHVTGAQVQEMLGLADKSAQRRLFASLLAGDGPALLDGIAAQFALGSEPLSMMRGLMLLSHRIMVAKLGKGLDEALSPDERQAIDGWAGQLSFGQLHRLWQLLLKGFEEVRSAPDPLISAQMALLRVMHAADMPDPGGLVKQLQDMAERGAVLSSATSATPTPTPVSDGPQAMATPQWEALVQQVDHAGHLRVAQIMRDWIRVAKLQRGELHYALVPGYAGDPAPDIRDALQKTTGDRWNLVLVDHGAVPALRETAERHAADQQAALRSDPLVEAVLAAFPAAEFLEESDIAPIGRETRKWSQRR